jgi:hypothetical protein
MRMALLDRLQSTMIQAGMASESSYDYGNKDVCLHHQWKDSLKTTVLTSDYACLLAEEFKRNPVVSDEAFFDLSAPFVPVHSYNYRCIHYLL